MINGKNYGNILDSCRCYYSNGVRRRHKKKYILMAVGKLL